MILDTRPATAPPSAPARRRTPRGNGLATLVFLLPMLVVFTVFSWLPIGQAVVMSFQQTNLVSDATFVGLENFRTVLSDPLLWTAVENTLWFAALALLFGPFCRVPRVEALKAVCAVCDGPDGTRTRSIAAIP